MSTDEFGKYLESNRNVLQKHKSFYMRWVRNFVRYCEDIPGLVVPEKQIDPFLTQLGRKYEHWQIKQAKDAVSLYCYFISTKGPVTGKINTRIIGDWKAAGETMVRMIRLKQLSYRTEQTVLSGECLLKIPA